MKYKVTVHVEYKKDYTIAADTQEAAEALALEYAESEMPLPETIVDLSTDHVQSVFELSPETKWDLLLQEEKARDFNRQFEEWKGDSTASNSTID